MYSLRFIGVMFGLALIIIAIRAIVKRVITERQSLFWIFSGLFYCFQKLAKLSRQVRDLAISASLYKQMLEEIQGNKQLPEAEKQAEDIGKEQ